MPNNIKTELFISSVRAMQSEIHANAKAHGWHNESLNDGEMIALRAYLLIIDL